MDINLPLHNDVLLPDPLPLLYQYRLRVNLLDPLRLQHLFLYQFVHFTQMRKLSSQKAFESMPVHIHAPLKSGYPVTGRHHYLVKKLRWHGKGLLPEVNFFMALYWLWLLNRTYDRFISAWLIYRIGLWKKAFKSGITKSLHYFIIYCQF